MKSLMWLLEGILLDSSMRCGAETHRDLVTASRRVEHEGMSFLTITLPKFAQDFERSLETGFVDTSRFLGFKKRGALPQFLGGLLCLVFDRVSGGLLAQPSADAILSVRQVCLAFKKLNLQCSRQRVKEALDGYVKCENQLVEGTADLSVVIDDKHRFPIDVSAERALGDSPYSGVSLPGNAGVVRNPVIRIRSHRTPRSNRGSRSRDHDLDYSYRGLSRMLWTAVFNGGEESHLRIDCDPRHGPGATAERIHGNAKYAPGRWHTRLNHSFPVDAYGVVSVSAIVDGELDKFEFVEPGGESPVRVTPVPKTQKGPRIIAIEPVCMQYAQQGLEKFITSRLSSHPLTAGRINFTDQSINRELALAASKDGKHATLDLSEASDRVHLYLVISAFEGVPNLLRALLDSRSAKSILPDGRTVHLSKFASMGSAACFPVLSMILFSIVLDARMRLLRLPLSMRNLEKASRDIYVYGDDLIVPKDEAPAIIDHLEDFLLKVNYHKSFLNGKFRESCGMDAYDGRPVTPVYIRNRPPDNRRQSDSLASCVSARNQFYEAGFWQTAKRLQEKIEQVFGQLPIVRDTSPGLGWYSYLGYQIQRWNKNLHRFEVSAPVIVPKRKPDVIDGWPALLKCLIARGKDPLDMKHLQTSVLRGEANIKRRWVTPW